LLKKEVGDRRQGGFPFIKYCLPTGEFIMSNLNLRRLTAIVLLAVPVIFNIFFTTLQITFEYPAILRKPADYVLTQFAAGGGGLIATWYGMVISAILFIPMAVLVHKTLGKDAHAQPWLMLATASGIVAGVVQFLGLIRWVFLVPMLNEMYNAPSATAATRETINVVFQAFNTYAGVAVGENMGYLFTGLWTILISVVLLATGQGKVWLARGGIVAGVAIMVGMLEPAGFEFAGMINVIGYLLWSVWLIAFGITLLRREKQPRVEFTAGAVAI
jgi:hypothetical protein